MVTLLMTIGLAMAQAPHKGERKQMDPKERAEKRTERMVSEYGLNDTQKAKLLELNMSMTEKMGDMPARRHHRKHHATKEGRRNDTNKKPEVNKEEREKKMAEMKLVRENYQSQLKEIFTAEQYQRFQAKQTERQEKMKENRKDKKDRKDRKSKKEDNKQA